VACQCGRQQHDRAEIEAQRKLWEERGREIDRLNEREEVAARAVRAALDVIEETHRIVDEAEDSATKDDLLHLIDRVATHLALAPALIKYAATTQGTPPPGASQGDRRG
jgi:hypothetical protein